MRGKNLSIAHPVLTRITTATEEPFVSVPNCLLLRLASKNASQVPPRLALTALQGEGSYGEGWESPLLPWGEAGGSGEGSDGQRGSAALAAQSPCGMSRAQARRQRCGTAPPHASEGTRVSVQCASVRICTERCFTPAHKNYCQVHRISMVLGTAEDGAKEQSKEGERKAGKGERKGQHVVAFPSTRTRPVLPPAPSAAASLPLGGRAPCRDAWCYRWCWQSRRDESPAKAHAGASILPGWLGSGTGAQSFQLRKQ